MGLAAGCGLLYDFTLVPEPELGALCADGFDNDFSGLVDCQDWSCLGERSCCDIPELVIADDFERGPSDCSTASCTEVPCAGETCPDPSRWHAWRCPYATVCQGALWPMSSGFADCLPVGVLAREPLALEPGLSVVVEVIGRPEAQGFLEAGLTLQTEVELQGALDPCATTTRPSPYVSVQQRRQGEGYVLVARFLQNDLAATSPILEASVPHQVAITVGEDRRISYLLDGAPFATTAEPLPRTERESRLVLHGLTQTAGFASVRVVAGRRCEAPAAWTPVTDADGPVLALGPPAGDDAWDTGDLYAPSARLGADGAVELYYSGCREALPGQCDPLRIGVGRATGSTVAPLVRDGAAPLFWIDALPIPAGTVPGSLRFAAFATVPPAGLASVSHAVYRVEPSFEVEPSEILSRDPQGWDAIICCAHGIRRAEDRYLLWYAGRASESEPWRIGLATSRNGLDFTKSEANPVLVEGLPDAFDANGARDPTVLWDPDRSLYRMWYLASDFFGGDSIGHAVSRDGVTWSKFPGNPVLRPETAGLTSLNGAAVLREPIGGLKMWLGGRPASIPSDRIYLLANDGAPSSP